MWLELIFHVAVTNAPTLNVKSFWCNFSWNTCFPFQKASHLLSWFTY